MGKVWQMYGIKVMGQNSLVNIKGQILYGKTMSIGLLSKVKVQGTASK